MDKKKILFLNCTLGLGGVERSLCDVLRSIDYSKYEVDLYLDSANGALMSQLPASVRIVYPNMDGTYGRFLSVIMTLIAKKDYKKIYLRVIKKLVNIFGYGVFTLLKPIYSKYGRYDTVFAYREGEITQFAYRAFKWDSFIGWWHYGGLPESNIEYKKLSKIKYLVAVSNFSKSELMQKFDYLADKLVTIPNIVDTKFINKKAMEFSPVYAAGIIHLVTVSRLSPEKHLENIIYCAKYLLNNNIKFQWHIVGGGLLYEKLKDDILRNELEGKVILEGEQSNPYPYVKSAHIYVHSSYVESQGLTILEAMALGIPCVVTKSLGPCEFIEDGVNGILTEQSPESLAEKVLEILTDRELYDRIKANTHCPAQFAPACVMQKIDRLLEEK